MLYVRSDFLISLRKLIAYREIDHCFIRISFNTYKSISIFI